MKRPSLFLATSAFRNLVAIAFRAVLFFLPFFLFAVPVGNPAMPALLQEGFWVPDTFWSSPQCGFSGDYLFIKKLRPSRSSRPFQLHTPSLGGTSEVLFFTWNIRDRFHVQGELGSGQFSWRWNQRGVWIQGKSEGGLLWSGDAKLIVWEAKETSFAVDVHAGGWDWMKGFASADGIALSRATRSQMRYWQVGAACAQKISYFSPYLGVAINHSRLSIYRLETGDPRFHARHKFGLFGGCSLSSGEKVLLNLEWRGWFEQGLSLLGQIRF